jgi:hypothetical protein
VCRIPLSIFCNAGLVFMCLSWKVFISPLILNNNFGRYSDLGCQLFTFNVWNVIPCFPWF